MLGHLRDSDNVSRDGESWQPLGALRQHFARSLHDSCPTQTWSRMSDREYCGRKAESSPRHADHMPKVARRRQPATRARYIAHARPRIDQAARQFAVLGTVLAAIFTAGIISVPSQNEPQRACQAAPAPGVNWNNCRLEQLELSYRDLSEANMRSARLSGAKLSSANLQRADLAYSDLSNADLRYADLRGARLIGANLVGAELGNANLREADLAYADLSGANLSGADLRGARLAQAIWVDQRICGASSVGRCN